MLDILLLVAGIYVLAALMVHLAYRLRRGKRETGKHYIWVAEGRQPNMEWYVRSLYAYSRRTGEDLRLTIVDCGMTEESRIIAERLAYEGKAVRFCKEETAAFASSAMGNEGHSEAYAERRNEESLGTEQQGNGKRFPGGNTDSQLLWRLQANGVLSQEDRAVLIDLQNPADLSKMPF